MATPISNPVDTTAFPLPFDDNGRQSNQAGYTQQLTVKARILTNGDIQVINSQNNSFYGTIKKGTKTFDANTGANLPNDLTNQLNRSISEISKKANEELVQNYGYTNDDANNFTGQNVLSSNTGALNLTPVSINAISSFKPGTRQSFDDLSYPSKRNGKQDHIKFTTYVYQPIKLNPTTPTSPKRSTSTPTGSITLPIQPSINDSNTVTWGSDTLNPIQAAGAVSALNAALEKGKSAGDIGRDFVYGLGKSMEAFGGDENTRNAIMAYFAGQAVGNQNLLSRLNGSVLNPNLELLFQGPELRNFNFNFQLTPRSKDDVIQVRKIIRTFKQAMAVQRSESELFLSAPLIFGIDYIFAGGSNSPYLPLIKDCALTNFSVDYTPDGSYMTYEDGSMTSYRLTMQFQELQPIYNDDYAVDGNTDSIIGY